MDGLGVQLMQVIAVQSAYTVYTPANTWVRSIVI